MKLRAVLILATMVLVVMLLSGVVLAKTCGATCYGDSGDNTLTGTNGKNTIHAKGGGDDVKGLRGKDMLYGGRGGDALAGGAGFDIVEGGTGYDWLNGNRGNDRLRGMEDPAALSTAYSTTRQKHRKVEVLIGDNGNDTIMARDGKKDIVRGGTGYDKAYVDRVDKVTGVEKEVVRGTGGGSPQPKQCNDGKDNDNDGMIDFGTQNPDPGCDSLADDTENTPPVAKNDSLTTQAGVHEYINVITNDTDVDGDTLSVSSFDATSAQGGTVTKVANTQGGLRYMPAGTYTGPDSFDYTVSDGNGGTDKGTVDVTVY